jgi:hypothetical protein
LLQKEQPAPALLELPRDGEEQQDMLPGPGLPEPGEALLVLVDPAPQLMDQVVIHDVRRWGPISALTPGL